MARRSTATDLVKLGTALAAVLAASPAFAQPVPEPVEAGQEEDVAERAADGEAIIVTARRTEENLQRVPASVSAFSERSLERIQAQDPTGLQGAVPNLNIVQGRGSSNATNIYIRGVGQPDALQTFDPAVGVYIDGVYLSRIRGTQLDLLDLQRVEVLRGPQGTLYGRNTIGGALSIVTRRPSQEFRGNITASLGNYDYREIRAAASGPVSDTVAAGFAFMHTERDGFVRDRVLDREYNDRFTQAARAQLAFTPDERLRVDFSADYSRDDASMTVGQPLNSLTYLLVPTVPSLVLPTNPTSYDFTARTTPTLPNSTRLQHWGVSMNVEYDFSDIVTLRSITAYRQLDTDDYIDIDATQIEVGDVFVGVDQNQISQELQINLTTDRLTAVGGLFFMREHVTSHQEAYADDLLGPPPALSFPFTRTIDDDLTTTSLAAYANVSYELIPALRVSAGIRYTNENRDYFRTTSVFTPILPPTPFVFEREQTWDDISPMASIDYQINPDTMIYARVARGFKSGGFNGRANSPTEATTYEPETMMSYELGLRTTIASQLRFNLTGFWNDYRNFQARVSGLETIGGLPTPVLSVLNAGRLTMRGFEVEASWTPVPGLLLDAQVGYLDAFYEEFADLRFPNGSRAFQEPAFAPDWTLRFGAQYEADLGTAGRLTFGGQARYRSAMALAVDNTYVRANVGTTERIAGLFSDPYWIVDARVVWESEDRRYSLGLYGQNITDTVYRTEGQEFSSVGSVRTVYYGAPMTWFIRGSYRF